MQTFQPGTAATIVIPLNAEDGTPYTVTAVDYELLDEAGLVVVARTVLSGYVSGDTEATVAVTAPQNNLGAGKVIGGRQINLYLTTDTGSVQISENYKLSSPMSLVVPDQSFMMHLEADIMADDMPQVDSWFSATKPEQIGALKEARDRIVRLRFNYSTSDAAWQSRVDPNMGYGDLEEVTAEEFAALPPLFVKALKQAQLAEAANILDSNAAINRRETGIFSETIGESSVMFRPGKAPRTALCPRAMFYLTKYIDNEWRIGRA